MAHPRSGSAAAPAESAAKPAARPSTRGCRVAGCSEGLAPGYSSKYRVCPTHYRLPSMQLGGQTVRFCQQCGRFHEVAEFEGDRRSCRASLARHKQRRRRAEARRQQQQDQEGQQEEQEEEQQQQQEEQDQAEGEAKEAKKEEDRDGEQREQKEADEKGGQQETAKEKSRKEDVRKAGGASSPAPGGTQAPASAGAKGAGGKGLAAQRCSKQKQRGAAAGAAAAGGSPLAQQRGSSQKRRAAQQGRPGGAGPEGGKKKRKKQQQRQQEAERVEPDVVPQVPAGADPDVGGQLSGWEELSAGGIPAPPASSIPSKPSTPVQHPPAGQHTPRPVPPPPGHAIVSGPAPPPLPCGGVPGGWLVGPPRPEQHLVQQALHAIGSSTPMFVDDVPSTDELMEISQDLGLSFLEACPPAAGNTAASTAAAGPPAEAWAPTPLHLQLQQQQQQQQGYGTAGAAAAWGGEVVRRPLSAAPAAAGVGCPPCSAAYVAHGPCSCGLGLPSMQPLPMPISGAPHYVIMPPAPASSAAGGSLAPMQYEPPSWGSAPGAGFPSFGAPPSAMALHPAPAAAAPPPLGPQPAKAAAAALSATAQQPAFPRVISWREEDWLFLEDVSATSSLADTFECGLA